MATSGFSDSSAAFAASFSAAFFALASASAFSFAIASASSVKTLFQAAISASASVSFCSGKISSRVHFV
jgi:hypothetical protein